MLTTIISFYTENTPYEDEVKYLIESCKMFNLPYEIEKVPHQGSWEKNCIYKSTFILEKLETLNRPLLWVDADGVFVKYPTLLETLSEDIGLCIIDCLPDEHPCKMISGTIFVNATSAAREILEKWIEVCKIAEEDEFCDQTALRDVLVKSNASVKNLSSPYFTTYDLVRDKEWNENAVIVHFQASRLLKKVVNGELSLFWDNDQITREKKKILTECFQQ